MTPVKNGVRMVTANGAYVGEMYALTVPVVGDRIYVAKQPYGYTQWVVAARLYDTADEMWTLHLKSVSEILSS